MSAIALLVIVLIAAILSSIVQAWVLTNLWAWFIVPTFDIAPLSIPVAIGIALILGMFFQQQVDMDKAKKSDTSELFGNLASKGFIGPLVVLFIGWIVSGFM
jgi:hypothetical protein